MPRQSRSKSLKKPRRKKRKRFKLLLDEMCPPCSKLRNLNRLHDLKHIRHNYHLAGVEDEVVFKRAKLEKRILITKNIKNFKPFKLGKNIGIIAISDKLLAKEIDKKLCSQFKYHSKNYFYGEIRRITGETKKKSKK